MATHTSVRLVDDIDGTEAAESVPFALDGKDYEIDLSDEHASKLRNLFAPYVAAARRAAGASARRASSPATATPKRSREETAAMRTWLAEHGYPIKERGRVPEVWQADYEAKTPNPPQRSTDEHQTIERAKPAVPVFQPAAG